LAPELEVWLITGGEGDIDVSMSPAITARAAAVPLSRGRCSALAPCWEQADLLG
jgi:hypothetical protein